MKLIFFNDAHIGDTLFCKSFIKQFCILNKDKDISIIVYYNSFIYNDIPNLKIINISNNNNYNNTSFNGNNVNPMDFTIFDNKEYLKHKYICDNFLKTYSLYYFDKINNTIYFKLWIGCHYTHIYNIECSYIECNLKECNNYYNAIINYFNNNYNLNYNLIENNSTILPTIPYSDISNFIEFKKNKKIIFYYNFYPNSSQSFPNINHDIIINHLAIIFPNYYICSTANNNCNLSNVLSLEKDFNIIKTIDCNNISKCLHCAILCDLVFTFDIGACFYFLSNDFNINFKNKWFHCSNVPVYFYRIKQYIDNNNINYININNNNDFINIINQIKLQSIE